MRRILAVLLLAYVAYVHSAAAQWISGGGSSTPGGTNGQLQYNNNGAFGGYGVGTGLTVSGGNLTATGGGAAAGIGVQAGQTPANIGDNATALVAGHYLYELNAALTTARSKNLPDSATQGAGALAVHDAVAAGGVTASNTLTLCAAGTDTLNGSAAGCLPAIGTKYFWVEIQNDGAGHFWTGPGSTVAASSAPANQFANGINNNGLTYAQPAFSNLSGNITAAQSLALTSAHLYVGTAGNVPADVALSGDATLANTGAITIANLAITNAKIANSTIDLTAKVTGTLPYGNGGTGATALTNHGAVVAGASALSTVAPGTNGNVLTSNGTDWTSAAAAGGGSGGGTFNYSDNGVTVTAGTYFVPIGGGGIPQTTETNVDVKAPSALTVNNLQVAISADPGSGQTLAVTFRKAASDQTLTCTITGTGGGAAVSCQDLTHSISVAQNDLIDWKIVTTGTYVATPTITPTTRTCGGA